MSKDVFDVIGIFKMFRDIVWLKRRVLYYVSIPLISKTCFLKRNVTLWVLNIYFKIFCSVCVYLHICECVHLCICEHYHGAWMTAWQHRWFRSFYCKIIWTQVMSSCLVADAFTPFDMYLAHFSGSHDFNRKRNQIKLGTGGHN